jgi:hypothetical protein
MDDAGILFSQRTGAAELRRLARRESGRVCQRVLMIANMLEQARFEPSVPLDSRRQNRECRLEYNPKSRPGLNKCGGQCRRHGCKLRWLAPAQLVSQELPRFVARVRDLFTVEEMRMHLNRIESERREYDASIATKFNNFSATR